MATGDRARRCREARASGRSLARDVERRFAATGPRDAVDARPRPARLDGPHRQRTALLAVRFAEAARARQRRRLVARRRLSPDQGDGARHDDRRGAAAARARPLAPAGGPRGARRAPRRLHLAEQDVGLSRTRDGHSRRGPSRDARSLHLPGSAARRPRARARAHLRLRRTVPHLALHGSAGDAGPVPARWHPLEQTTRRRARLS